MIEAMLGLSLGLAAGGVSVYSLWLITGFTARASRGLYLPEPVERPSGWDVEAQDPDVVTTGQWLRARQEAGVALSPPPTPPHRPVEAGQDSKALRRDDEEGSVSNATLWVFFAFLLKAPILILIAVGVRSLGNATLHWCVGGVVSVYSLAVFWAAARTRKG